MNLKKVFQTFFLLVKKDGYKRAEYIKKKQLFGSMGDYCYFHPYLMPSDPKNIFIGNNVKVASEVLFVNHDIIGSMLNKMLDVKEFKYDVKNIVIEDNVMIGSRAIILPGVTIHSNCIIGAGCVVSKDVPENSVAVGNPIRVVGTLENYIAKRKFKSLKNEKT